VIAYMLRELDAQLQKGDNPGAWTCVLMDVHADGRRCPSCSAPAAREDPGAIDGEPFTGALMAHGDGTHRLPVKAALRDTIGKTAGDTVHVQIEERIG
jgi:hypothetical protein